MCDSVCGSVWVCVCVCIAHVKRYACLCLSQSAELSVCLYVCLSAFLSVSNYICRYAILATACNNKCICALKYVCVCVYAYEHSTSGYAQISILLKTVLKKHKATVGKGSLTNSGFLSHSEGQLTPRKQTRKAAGLLSQWYSLVGSSYPILSSKKATKRPRWKWKNKPYLKPPTK